MKDASQVGLIRKNVADRDALIGDQHGQLADGMRARPECLINEAILLDVSCPGQGDRLDKIEGLPHADRVQDFLDRSEGLVLPVGRITDYLE